MVAYNLGVAGMLVAAVVWADANAQVRQFTTNNETAPPPSRLLSLPPGPRLVVLSLLLPLPLPLLLAVADTREKVSSLPCLDAPGGPRFCIMALYSRNRIFCDARLSRN